MGEIKGVDQVTLTLMDALDLAVLVEEEARDRYEELAEQMDVHHTRDAARFFRFMAKNEEKHRDALAKRRAELFGDQPRSVEAAMVFDVEAPEYDEARMFMSTREALETAHRSETKAHAFFVTLLERVSDQDARALLEELREEEIVHRRLVEAELAKLDANAPLAGDLADDPTDH